MSRGQRSEPASRCAARGCSEAQAATPPRGPRHPGALRIWSVHGIRESIEPMAKGKAAKPETANVPIRWLDEVAEHDYAAAQAYLSLRLDEQRASKVIARLRKAPLTKRRANDILRAART